MDSEKKLSNEGILVNEDFFFEKAAHIRKGLLQQAKNLKSCLFRKKKRKKEGMIF